MHDKSISSLYSHFFFTLRIYKLFLCGGFCDSMLDVLNSDRSHRGLSEKLSIPQKWTQKGG